MLRIAIIIILGLLGALVVFLKTRSSSKIQTFINDDPFFKMDRQDRILVKNLIGNRVAQKAKIEGLTISEWEEKHKDDKPKYYLAAEKEAATRGMTVEQVLAEYDQCLKNSKYPGADCWDPSEIKTFINNQKITSENGLPDDLKIHLETCGPCRSLVRMGLKTTEEKRSY